MVHAAAAGRGLERGAADARPAFRNDTGGRVLAEGQGHPAVGHIVRALLQPRVRQQVQRHRAHGRRAGQAVVRLAGAAVARVAGGAGTDDL